MIRHLTVVNPTEYDINLGISSATNDGRTDIGTAPTHASTTFDDIIDQGTTWVFHFDGQGDDGGELQISRQLPARAGWRITIPDQVAPAHPACAGRLRAHYDVD